MQTHHIRLAATALLGAVFTYDLVASRRNKAINHSNQMLNETLEQANKILFEANEQLCERLGMSYVQLNYLINKLNEHGVPCDEFDAIVLHSLNQ